MNQTKTVDLSEKEKSSQYYLSLLEQREKTQAQRFSGVRTVLVVLSAKAMVYDVESLRQKVVSAYPEAAIFFKTTSGKPMGVPSPHHIDLLIDLTGPGQRQPWFYSRKLRGMAQHAVGRNAGFFRKKIYDRIFDEKTIGSQLPRDLFDRERFVQKEVLALAGVPLVPAGDLTQDKSKQIALELPPLNQQ